MRNDRDTISPDTAFIEGGTTQDERSIPHPISRTLTRRVNIRDFHRLFEILFFRLEIEYFRLGCDWIGRDHSGYSRSDIRSTKERLNE